MESKKSKNKRCKIDRPSVYLDFKGAIKLLEKGGVKKDLKTIATDIGFSTVSVGQWQKEAPEVVTMLFHFLKDNCITFEQFVKLCQPTEDKND
jgi:hypothetical protein